MEGSSRWTSWLILALTALAAAPCLAQEREKKVLILGIDGVRSDALVVADTPYMDALVANGVLALNAQTEDYTISGTCWSSILHGVHKDRHQVDNNEDYGDPSRGNNLDAWPDVFSRLEQHDPSLVTARFSRWDRTIETPSTVDINHHQWRTDGTRPSDQEVADEAAQFLAGAHPLYQDNPDAFFVYFGDVDMIGHGYGFDPSPGSQYVASIEAHDTMVGQILSTVASRSTYANEEWLTIMVTDHGGVGNSHLPGVEESRTVPLIVSGDAVVQGPLFPHPRTVDVVPTVLSFMGVPESQMTDLDGHVLGLAPSLQPPSGFGVNLLFNADGEYNRGMDDATPDQYCSGWEDHDLYGVSLMRYDALSTPPAEGPDSRGDNFFIGGTAGSSRMTQTIDLGAIVGLVDQSRVQYDLAAYLGGWGSQNDAADLTIRFLDDAEEELATDTLLGPRAGERGNVTSLLPRESTGEVPTGTRFIEVILGMTRDSSAGGDNDGFADNLSLVLTTTGMAADLNGDGFVGGDDLDLVRAFWGQSVIPGNLLSGDPSGDGFVGGDDLDLIRAHWGQTAALPSAVPEPSAFAGLAVLGLFSLLRHSSSLRQARPRET